mgnify:CR=1 FL=1
MKETLYIDFNVLTNYMKDENVRKKIVELKNRYDIYCSPAHFEEIAKIMRKMEDNGNVSKGYIRSHIEKLEELTDRRIIYFPTRSVDDKLAFMNSGKVDFKTVYNRVVRNMGTILTASVEGSDKANLLRWKKVRASINNDENIECEYTKEQIECLNPQKVSMNTPEKIFEDSSVNFICSETVWDKIGKLTPSDLRNVFQQDREKPYWHFEIHIECAMKILNYSGYHSDTANLESPTHDISHAHYGSICSDFVTFDEKFYFRIKAAYYWLGVPTKVHLFSEF